MASESEVKPYRCDKCGGTNIVAASVVYQQGTRTYSGVFSSGVSQSQEALVAAPPKQRGYRRSLLTWGIATCFAFFWGFAGLSRMSVHPHSASLGNAVVIFLLASVFFVVGLLLSVRRVARYNRDVYPQLLWDWERTFICRRCGTSLIVPSES